MNTSPSACVLQGRTLTLFPTRTLLHLWQMTCWTMPSTDYTGSLLVVPQFETHCNNVLLSDKVRFAMKMLSFLKWGTAAILQARAISTW